MANNSDVKKLVKELEKAIEYGLNLFKGYKQYSKEFQEQQKNLMENRILKIKFANLKQKYDEEMKFIMAKRKSIIELKELPNHVKEKQFKNTEVKEYRQEYKNMVEKSLVNSNKKFLKKKENLRKLKKIILSKIKKAFSQLKKKMFENEFKDFVKYMKEAKYDVSNNKTITFQKLMNHLESAEITEEASKKTKKNKTARKIKQ